MYYIKVEKPENCSKCKFSRPYYATTEDMTEFSYLCNLLGVVCSGTIKPHNCPIKELKPKQLKWRFDKESNEFVSDNTNCKLKFYWFEGDYEHNESGWSVEISLIIDGKESFNYDFDLPHIYSEDDAKNACQKFYNKLFYEMIGE